MPVLVKGVSYSIGVVPRISDAYFLAAVPPANTRLISRQVRMSERRISCHHSYSLGYVIPLFAELGLAQRCLCEIGY